MANSVDGIPIADFGKYGLEGTIFAGMLWLLYNFSNRNDRIQESRVSEQKAGFEIVQLNSTTMAAVNSTAEARNRAAEATAKAMELQALALTQLTTEIGRLREAFTSEVQRLRETQSGLQNRVEALREQVLQRGGTL